MGVLDVTQVYKRGGSKDRTTRNYHVKYRATCTPDTDIKAVLDAASVPQVGDYCSWDSHAICENVTTESVSQMIGDDTNPKVEIWEIDVDFTTNKSFAGLNSLIYATGGGGQPGSFTFQQDINPLSRPPEVSRGQEEEDVEMVVDADGVDVLNSAGQPFENGPRTIKIRPTWTIVNNEWGISEIARSAYSGKTNSLAVTIGDLVCEPGTLRCSSITSSPHFESGYLFEKITYQFSYEEDGWDQQYLQAGYMVKDADGKLVHPEVWVVDDDNPSGHYVRQPANEQVLLTVDGLQNFDSDNPVTVGFKRFKRINFNALGFFGS